MDRKNTIKTLRDITRKLEDDFLFSNQDFDRDYSESFCESKVEHYIKRRLQL